MKLVSLVTSSVLLLLPARALAQSYRFPTTLEHWDHFAPTAYKDHAGTDYDCGDIRYAGHGGSDFGAGSFAGMDEGRDIVAAADGTVSAVHDGEFDRCTGECTDGGYGNFVIILHADGKSTIYGHLKKWSVAVQEGDNVACGDLLGQMGSSGNSTGPHIHFEVRSSDNVAQDPFLGECSNPPSYWVRQWAYRQRPLPYCEGALPPCAPLDLITCGAAIEGNNGGPGSTQTHVAYGCTDFGYTGPEVAWRFVTDTSEPVTIDLTGHSEDVDLYLLEGAACDVDSCLDASASTNVENEQLTFDAVAGVEYVLVVDGFRGASTDFQLSITCTGTLPPQAPDAGPEPLAPEEEAAGGCGCQSGSQQGSHLASLLMSVLLLGAAGLRRRRRS